MYPWAQMVGIYGFSFREAYRNTRLKSYYISNTSQFRKKGNENYNPDQQPSQNRANEAFREFLKTMKTDCPNFKRLAFSCSRCEVPLTPDDCAQLNIDKELADDLQLKRFKAIFIDGTAAGVLAKLPKYTRLFSALKSIRLIHHNGSERPTPKGSPMPSSNMFGGYQNPQKNKKPSVSLLANFKPPVLAL